MIEVAAREAGVQRGWIGSTEIVERTVYAMINEGARILDEKFARCSSDIDTVFLNGYGFPASRGGPMLYADGIGLRTVYERTLDLQRIHGAGWEPAPLLTRLAEANESFSVWDARQLL